MTVKTTITNRKGGTGKSTTTLNLGVTLVEQGYKVLLCDLDSQADLTAYTNRPKNLEKTLKTILDKMLETFDAADPRVPLPGEVIQNVKSKLYILPSSMYLDLTGKNLDASGIGNQLLPLYFEEHAEYFNQFDFILFDTSAAQSTLNDGAFLTADNIIIVTDVSTDSAEGIQNSMAWTKAIFRTFKKELNIAGVLINNASMNTKFYKTFIEEIGDTVPGSIFNTVIPRSTALPESRKSNLGLIEYNPNHKVAKLYKDFAREYIERVKK